MRVEIIGEAKEIAALVASIQERQEIISITAGRVSPDRKRIREARSTEVSKIPCERWFDGQG